MLALLADALGKNGDIEEGMNTVRAALTFVQETGERYFESELYRLYGEFLLVRGEPEADVEANLQRAIDISRRQEARSLELRAAMSLARLWQSQGKQQEAYQMLATIYGWFTEGFDTTDLKEAGALLRELS
jgi:predicted ATPase